MEIADPLALLSAHRVFRDLEPTQIELLAGCAARRNFAVNTAMFRQGGAAEHCYLIGTGRVSLEVTSPQGRALTIQTIGPGELLGWSWLFPPYRWHFDARALEATVALALDAVRVREACENDPALGYELMKRMSRIIHERMQAARMQIIDLYAPMPDLAEG